MKKPSTKRGPTFPTQITLKIYELTPEEVTQDSRAMAVYPDGLAYSGTVTVLRKGPDLRITFKGQL